MHTIRSWCRANAMLAISLLAAAATAFFVPPDSAYLGYYDLKTLSCLFSVLAVVQITSSPSCCRITLPRPRRRNL